MAILGGVAAIFAWLFRGWLADKKEQELNNQLDTAKTDLEKEKIKTQAQSQEKNIEDKQKQKEDSIRKSGHDDTANQLDSMFGGMRK